MTTQTHWRRCSSCKTDIAFQSAYWQCNVSTCNRKKNPFFFCSDALVIGPPGCGTTIDVYQSWSAPANPQAHVTEAGGQTGVVTDDLVDLP